MQLHFLALRHLLTLCSCTCPTFPGMTFNMHLQLSNYGMFLFMQLQFWSLFVLPCPSFPCLFWKRQGKPPEKHGFVYPYRSPKIAAKDRKDAQKTRNSSQREKTRNSNKKERKDSVLLSLQGGPGSDRFGCGSCTERFDFFGKVGFPMFEYSLTEGKGSGCGS